MSILWQLVPQWANDFDMKPHWSCGDMGALVFWKESSATEDGPSHTPHPAGVPHRARMSDLNHTPRTLGAPCFMWTTPWMFTSGEITLPNCIPLERRRTFWSNWGCTEGLPPQHSLGGELNLAIIQLYIRKGYRLNLGYVFFIWRGPWVAGVREESAWLVQHGLQGLLLPHGKHWTEVRKVCISMYSVTNGHKCSGWIDT